VYGSADLFDASAPVLIQTYAKIKVGKEIESRDPILKMTAFRPAHAPENHVALRDRANSRGRSKICCESPRPAYRHRVRVVFSVADLKMQFHPGDEVWMPVFTVDGKSRFLDPLSQPA
jgi:hypothetical protein